MKYIIFLSFLILSFSSQAAPTCSKNGTTIIYTNGVTTKRPDAQNAMEKIDALSLDSQIDLEMMNDSVLAYNYEESKAKDFLEAAVQRFPTRFLQAQGVTNGYAAYMAFLSGGLSDAIYAVALNSIVNKYLEIESNWIRDHFNNQLYLQTVRETKGHYEDALNNGERVFAISHSQGGLFMSDAFSQTSFTDKQKHFSGFQIASPLPNEMSSHFGYATHDKDRLINFVRGTIGALPANVIAPLIVSNTYPGDLIDDGIEFIINHGIVTTYLNDSTIKSQVIPLLIATAQLLESNCPKAVINITNKNNLEVSFDSTDPEAPNVTGLTYSWNFGDGQTANTTSKTLSHTYAQAGTYNVSLTVTDAYGASDTASVSVIVTGGGASVTFCNIGNLTSTMDFSLSSGDAFSLYHYQPTYQEHNDGTKIQCECRTLNLQQNSTYNLTVGGTLPDIGAMIPYIGSVTIKNQQEVFSTSYQINAQGRAEFLIYRGAAFGNSCEEYITK